MKSNIKRIIFVVLICIFLFSIFQICTYFVELNRNQKTHQKVIQEVVKIEKVTDEENGEVSEKLTINYDSLLNINSDSKGWIRFNQDKIHYPIVQSVDNRYYLNHDIYKNSSSLGAIFMDYRNQSFQDKNVVIFGHNVSPGEAMFGSLKDVLNNHFFDQEENRMIEIMDLNNHSYFYEIFSVYTISVEEYYITTNFNNNEEYIEFLNTIKERSIRDFDIDLSTSDHILTLSTCDGYSSTNKRLVVHARLK